MSKRAVVWVIAYVTGLTLSVADPFWALLAYLLDYYNHPPLRWWGDELPDLRWSLMSSLVLLGAYVAHGRNLLDARIFRHGTTQWLLALLAVATLVTPFAISWDSSVHYLTNLAQLTMLFILIVGTVRTPRHYELFIVALVAGATIWGLDAYFDPVRRAGRLQAIGGPDSLNDNRAAGHLLATLPLVAGCFWMGPRWQKILAVVAAPFILNTIILCSSRSATLAIVVAALAAIVLAGRGLRQPVLIAVVVGAVLVVPLMDERFVARQLTILDPAVDSSAEQRVESWKGALNLIADYPLGTGGGGYDVLSPVYIADVVAAHEGEERSVHNTFLWVAADWGIPGAICFLGFVGSALVSLYRLQRSSSDQRLGVDCLTLQVALVGFLVAGFFGNRLYAEMVYWLTALSVARHNIAWNVWAETEETASEVEFGHSFPPVATAPAWSPVSGVRGRQVAGWNARSQGPKVHG